MGGHAGGQRPGWVRDVELPRSLDELRGPLSGTVRLPLRIYWTGPDPESVEWDVSSPQRRARLYEVVLREGSLDDVRTFVDGENCFDCGSRSTSRCGYEWRGSR